MKKEKQSFAVLFYAPWCGHCKAFKPEYSSAALKLNGIVELVAINCDAEPNKAVCGTQNISGFPTVKLYFANNGKTETYLYERKADVLVKWMLQNIKRPFTQVRARDAIQTLERLDSFLLIATPADKPSSALYKLALTVAKGTEVFVVTNYGLEDIGTLKNLYPKIGDGLEVLLKKNGKTVRYEGPNVPAEV